VDVLAEHAARSARSAVLAVYEYTDNGEVKYVEPQTLLTERVPSISEVVDKMLSWAARTAASRREEEEAEIASA